MSVGISCLQPLAPIRKQCSAGAPHELKPSGFPVPPQSVSDGQLRMRIKRITNQAKLKSFIAVSWAQSGCAHTMLWGQELMVAKPESFHCGPQ